MDMDANLDLGTFYVVLLKSGETMRVADLPGSKTAREVMEECPGDVALTFELMDGDQCFLRCEDIRLITKSTPGGRARFLEQERLLDLVFGDDDEGRPEWA